MIPKVRDKPLRKISPSREVCGGIAAAPVSEVMLFWRSVREGY